MYNWNGKKLLVLGATKFIAEIVLAAKRYGAYVIAVDYNCDAPAKRIADEALLMNVMDVDAIVKYIKENKDGEEKPSCNLLLDAKLCKCDI